MTDICLFEGRPPEISTRLIDTAWGNYFGTSHGFAPREFPRRAAYDPKSTGEHADANPLQL
jgi:hypothetical protein